MRIIPVFLGKRLTEFIMQEGYDKKWWFILLMALITLLFVFFCVAVIIMSTHADYKSSIIKGADLLESGKINESIRYFKKALKDKKADAINIRSLLITIYNMEGRYKDAISELKKVQPLLGGVVEVMLGDAYNKDLIYSDIEKYKNSLPRSLKSRVFLELAGLMRHDKIWGRAMRAYRIAIESDPEFRILKEMVIDNLYREQGEIEKDDLALKEYEKIVKICPSYENYMTLGTIYYESDKDKAISFYKEALKLAQDAAEPYRLISEAYSDSGRPEEALENIKKAVDLEPSHLGYRGELILMYIILGRPEDAMREYRTYKEELGRRYDKKSGIGGPFSQLELLVDEKIVTFVLLRHYMDTSSLGVPLDKIPEDKKPFVLEHMNKALKFEQQGEYLKAIEEHKRSLGLFETASSNVALGLLYLEKNDCKSSTKYLERALDISTLKSVVFFNLCSVYLQCGEAEKAIKVAKQLLDENPRDPIVLYYLGIMLYDKKNLEEAIRVFERLKESDEFAFLLISDKFEEARKELEIK